MTCERNGVKCWHNRPVAGDGCRALSERIKKDCPFYTEYFDEKKCEQEIEKYSGTTWQQKHRRLK